LRHVKLKKVSFKLIKNNRQSGSDRRRTGVDFDLQPTLKGNLIELRPLGPQDFDALFSAASDPKIWEQHPESDRYQREVFQRFFDGALESRGAFAIIERESRRIIGSSRYCNLDLANREVEIGWTFLEREFWGGTYNRELKQLMLDHAFRFVDRVIFVVGENNIRSQKALAKIGANFLKKAQLPVGDGTLKTNLVFVITAESYRAIEPSAQHQKAVLAETPKEII
jgi:RimJ/RimL family protein N-acetyltransferase